MFDIVFMRQKWKETALLIWTKPHKAFIHSAQSLNVSAAQAYFFTMILRYVWFYLWLS